uniref:DOMON domain-containing protein n=1 Tax=Caenorhabditis tropicalis TaxID=1561998 RepID=A0A1I7TTE8_9PELO
MMTWKHERRHLIIEIESKLVKPDMWLGIGFSKDGLMGNDTVFECQFPASGSGSVLLSHNTAKRNIVLKTASELLIRDGFTEFTDGKAMCGGEWILDNIHLDSQERTLMHVISSGRYNLFFAFGKMENGEKKMHGMVGKEAPWKSQEQVRFCQRCSSSFANVDSVATDEFKKL